MSHRSVSLLDPAGSVVATADVECLDHRYSGRVDVNRMPPALRLLFEEYEDLVNGQIFSLLDPVERQIGDLSLEAAFGDGRQASVEDLQIFPGDGTISFRLAEPAKIVQSQRMPINAS